ncbi:MAG: septation protein SpoVG family protein [Candidatus Omnitrophica bacterium]|nr:septation protein SpoVG family protein [Candidatus Omnitrophota bacterium]
MEITEVRIFPREGLKSKLKAYATITIDNAFVVRSIKIIEGKTGLFVAMPSRRMKDPCPKCGHKNEVRSKFCNECGSGIPAKGTVTMTPEAEHDARQSEHKDTAHPITVHCREDIQKKVLAAYEADKKKPEGI